MQPLLLARQHAVDDRAGEAVARQHPRRLDHRRGARAVVIGAGRVGGRVHRIGDAAVDMAGDDDDAIGIGACRAGWRRHSRPGSGVGMRRPVTVSDGPRRSRGSRRSRARSRANSACVQRSAAPIPRVGWSRADSVWRVPKPTSRSTVARSRASDTWSAMRAEEARAAAGAGAAAGRRRARQQPRRGESASSWPPRWTGCPVLGKRWRSVTPSPSRGRPATAALRVPHRAPMAASALPMATTALNGRPALEGQPAAPRWPPPGSDGHRSRSRGHQRDHDGHAIWQEGTFFHKNRFL